MAIFEIAKNGIWSKKFREIFWPTVDRVPETWVLEVTWRNGFLGKFEQGFSSHFAIFLSYLIVFQSFAEPSVYSTIHQNIPKIWQK